jgi:enamine deaminase RidA (YjgF/YER057c/UK114 family)
MAAQDQHGSVTHINPEGMHKNPAFTQVIAVSGPARTIYIGGQNAVDGAGNIVGKGDMRQQSEQAFRNLQTALQAAGAGLEHLVKCTIHVVQGQSLYPGFEAYQRAWGGRPNPPTVTVLMVAGLANPDFLLEIDAIAVVPE